MAEHRTRSDCLDPGQPLLGRGPQQQPPRALSLYPHAPYPSLADAGYLLALPGLFIGIALLVKERAGHFTLANWIDGAVGGLAAATVATMVLSPVLIGATKGDLDAVLTNLAYPVGDLVLVALLAWGLIVAGAKSARGLLLLALGLLVWSGADIAYLYESATGSYGITFVDLGWPLGALLLGLGALLSRGRAPSTQRLRRASALVPGLSTLVAVGVLLDDHFNQLHPVSVWLAAATVAAVAIRLILSAKENDSLMVTLQHDAAIDSLTGLANRRQLFEDLRGLLERDDRPVGDWMLAIFDLNGFKGYNDSFGHAAGDTLLRRVGVRLSEAVDGTGVAYRLGGMSSAPSPS